MRVLFISSGTKDPATRFRVTQFFPSFEKEGIECFHRFAYGEHYNAVFNSPVGAFYKLGCRAKRALHTVAEASHFDILFLQRTAFNETAWPERIAAARNPRIVFDYDDAIFLDSRGMPSPQRRRTFCDVVNRAHHLIAGNQYLAQEADRAEKTTVIPTVIDTDRFSATAAASDPGVTIGWMGTAGNFAFFKECMPAVLQILADFEHVRLHIVSNARYQGLEGHPKVRQTAWSEESELNDLRSFDIGIMPLTDSPWTRGKCAFKLIQYMSVARPVVASAVGANVELLAGYNAGFLASTTEEWIRALQELVASSQLRFQMGEAARKRVVDAYSIKSVLPRYIEIFQNMQH